MDIINKLRGTGVAIVTPFTKNNKIDFKGLESIVSHLIRNKVNYIVGLGTTGESVNLSKKEKHDVMQCIVASAGAKIPVVLGNGGNSTSAVMDAFDHFDLKGISAILSVSPYYNKPNQEGIFQHFKAIAQFSPLPILLYNVPGRTGSNITAETTIRLALETSMIIGIKEASGNLQQVIEILAERPANFLVLSGDDALTLPILACGGDGVISVIGNAFPKAFSNLVRAALKGDLDQARQIHYQLLPFIDAIFADGNPAGIKELMHIQGLCEPHVRLPLVRVNEAVQRQLEDLLAQQ